MGPLLFIIYINDLPERIRSLCSIYADDTKIFKILDDLYDKSLQEDIDSLTKWCDSWKMSLNSKKCKVMHIGKKNPKHKYLLKDGVTGKFVETESTICERDLGVNISSNGNFDLHVSKITAKTNALLGMFSNTFTNFTEEIARTIYPTFIRPHLEFAVPVWNPRLRGCIGQLERVQRRATRSIYGFKGLSYDERMKKLGLTDLETRRIRGDLIQYYKIQSKLDNVNWHFFKNEESHHGHNLRGHNKKIQREPTDNTSRHHFFMNRVSKVWNQLPCKAVEAKSLNSFKAELDKWISTFKKADKVQ